MIIENLYKIFYDFSFITVDILFFFLFIYSYNKIRRHFGSNVLLKFIFFFIAVKLVLYYFLPSIFRIFSSYQFEAEDHVKIFDLLRVYIIELCSWFFWMSGFFLVLLLNIKSAKKSVDIETENFNESKHLLFIFAIGFLIQTYYSISQNQPNLIFSLFGQLFFFTGLSIGPILLFLSNKFYNKLYFFIGLICFALSLLSLSTRGAFVYSVLFIIFIVFWILKTRKAKITLIVVLVSSIILFLSIGSVTSRISIDENGINLIPKEFSEKNEGRTFMQEIEWRFGASTRIGTGFLVMYEEGNSAGFNPITNSLLGFLPRSIDPKKPHPSTLDGQDFFSQGMYLIMAKVEGNPTSMVEFPTGCHFYWEFGSIGVIVLSLISGFYIGVCYLFFKKLGLISLSLILATFKPWGYVDPKIWISDIAMQLYQIILPLIIIILIYRFVHTLCSLKIKKVV